MTSAIGKSAHTTRWIAVAKLSVVWVEAQRPINPRRVKQIAENFDPDMFGVILVTQPDKDGMHHVIDGQHRVDAVRRIWGEKECVPCNVFEASDPARAAQIFDTVNTSRKPPQPMDRFRVRVTAGIEPEVSVHRLITGLGYKFGMNGDDGTVSAVASCVGVYKNFGQDVLLDAMLVLRAAFGRTRASVDGHIIAGFAEFLATHGNNIDRQRLVNRVSKNFTPARLLGQARSARDMFGGTVANNISAMLAHAYNHNLRQGRIGEAA